MLIHTIGFTKKSAEYFFGRLKKARVRLVLDTRLHNTSQLSGFAKQDDLSYFLREMQVAEYQHATLLAPTDDLLDSYKKGKISWSEYEAGFLGLMEQRQVERKFTKDQLDGACLLCSEDKPHQCHRRLVAEYFKKHWGDVEISHI